MLWEDGRLTFGVSSDPVQYLCGLGQADHPSDEKCHIEPQLLTVTSEVPGWQCLRAQLGFCNQHLLSAWPCPSCGCLVSELENESACAQGLACPLSLSASQMKRKTKRKHVDESLCSFISFFSFKTYLFICKTELGKDRKREIFHALVHTPNGCRSHSWAVPKAGARNNFWVSLSHLPLLSQEC